MPTHVDKLSVVLKLWGWFSWPKLFFCDFSCDLNSQVLSKVDSNELVANNSVVLVMCIQELG